MSLAERLTVMAEAMDKERRIVHQPYYQISLCHREHSSWVTTRSTLLDNAHKMLSLYRTQYMTMH